MRTVVVRFADKEWLVAEVEIPSDNRDERVSFARMALEEGLNRFNPVCTASPPAPIDFEKQPRIVWTKPMLTTKARIELLSEAFARAIALDGEVVEDLRRDIVTHWWRHVGNAEVMRMEGAVPQWSETADLLHMMQFQKRRKFGFESVMVEIEKAIKMAQESHAFEASAKGDSSGS